MINGLFGTEYPMQYHTFPYLIKRRTNMMFDASIPCHFIGLLYLLHDVMETKYGFPKQIPLIKDKQTKIK